MATNNAASSHHIAILEEFKRITLESTTTAVCDRTFIRVDKLMAWLRSPRASDGHGPQRKQIAHLADAAYKDSLKTTIKPPIDESTLLRFCPLTFCLLVQLGRGYLIDHFQRHHLIDSSLPTMDSATLRTKIESDPVLVDRYGPGIATSLAREFDELRWRYFAPSFELRRGAFFPKKSVLPVVRKKPINAKGGTAKLYRIEVPEEFVGDSLRKEVANSVCDRNDGLGKRYIFALKSFDESNKHHFQNETHAFLSVQHNGMVKYLANFDREELDPVNAGEQQQSCTKTYNILLQYGDCDLDEYFIQNYPPLSSSRVLDFWQDLFEVAETVKGIHKINDHYQGTFRGWHADIKPDNILLVQGKFKLADPGFMKIVLEQPNNAQEVVKAVLDGGTRTYGAPEMYAQTKFPVSQTIDIWSLGCVFSIAATWAVIGRHGVAWFYKVRSDAIKKLGLQLGAVPKNHGDQFHDGEQLLDAVREWHKLLRLLIRDTDHITSKVLEIVDNYMLVKDPDERDKAEALCGRLKSLLQSAREAKPQIEFPQSIMDAIKTPDTYPYIAPGSIERSIEDLMEKRRQPMRSEERSDLTSEVLNLVAMSTARPSAAFKRDLYERPKGTNSQLRAIAKSVDMSQPASSGTKTQPAETSERAKPFLGLSIVKTQKKEQSPSVRLNIFDAHQVLESEQRWYKRKKADRYISDHYKDRDIIFLIDNSGSMEPLWSQTIFLLGVVFRLMSRQGDVRMRLHLTFGQAPKEFMTSEGGIKRLMTSDTVKPRSDRRTDIEASLGEIFHERIQILTKAYGQKRALTLMVLTDGIWEGTRNKSVVKDKIAKFVKEVSDLQGRHRKRPVSIQFIQFGRDLDAMFFLQHLDDRLGDEAGIPDVIDFEPADGDVYKMLLGSFVEEYDSREPEEAVVGGPSSLGSSGTSFEHVGYEQAS